MRRDYSLARQRLLVLLVLLVCTKAQAQIVLDGTVGPAGPLSGPGFLIPAELGHELGGNLFHSFTEFNINTGESATFTGPAVIDNVIGRVTGGSISTIDGLLASDIAGADVYLINPAGVLFGPNAQIDVKGSFKVSTADRLTLSDGGSFDATTPANSNLTIAPVEAFGFVGDQPAPIIVDHSQLIAGEGGSISLLGGDIRIENGELIALDGDINLASVASSGEVTASGGDLQLEGFSALGDILISNDPDELAPALGNIVVFGHGSAWIRAGRLDSSGGVISSFNLDAVPAGPIDIAAEYIALNGGGIQSVTGTDGQGAPIALQAVTLTVEGGATVLATTDGSGDGGDITIDAERLSLSGSVQNNQSSIATSTDSLVEGAGAAGSISVDTSTLEISDGAGLLSLTLGSGAGGDITVDADRVSITGISESEEFPSALQSIATEFSTGDAGTISIDTTSLELLDGGTIRASTIGLGNSGPIKVNAERVLMAGATFSSALNGFIVSAIESVPLTRLPNAGDSGGIDVTASAELVLRGGAHIVSGTGGSGAGGDITIVAGSLQMSGDTADGQFATAIESIAAGNTEDSGAAGNVMVRANTVELSGGARIATTTAGPGRGGNIDVDAGEVKLVGTNASGTANSNFTSGTIGSGRAGDVSIRASSLELAGGASVNASTGGSGDGGDIDIESGRVVVAGLDSTTDAFTFIGSATTASGAAGDVRVRADTLQVLDGGVIGNNTTGSGDGGDLHIEADRLLMGGGNGGNFVAAIGASSNDGATGDSGTVTVVAGTLTMLDGARITAATDGIGDGGTIDITATDRVELAGNAEIISESRGQAANSGIAGEISMVAPLILLEDASIVASSVVGGGGNVTLSGGSLQLLGASKINADAGGVATGGNVRVATDTVAVLDSSRITAKAAAGLGGRIVVDSDVFLREVAVQDDVLDASGGTQGVVEVTAPELDLSAGLVELSSGYLNRVALQDRCGTRTADIASSLSLTDSSGRPGAGLEDWQLSDLADGEVGVPGRVIEQGLWHRQPYPELALAELAPECGS